MVNLRGHHLLCLHGFRGLGYSPEFVENMRQVHDLLRESPETEVKVLTSPDDICSACPHLAHGNCAKNGDESERRISDKDSEILGRLTLSPGSVLSAYKLFSLATEEFGGRMEEVCSSCSWFPMGWCEEGIRARTMNIESESDHRALARG